MKSWYALLLVALLAVVFSACPSLPKPKPDDEKVRQDHRDAQQDLKREEAQRENRY